MGLSYSEVARRLGVPKTTLYYALNPEKRREHHRLYMRRLLGSPRGRRPWRRVSDEEAKLIAELYLRGVGAYGIARAVDRPLSTVYATLRRLGLR